ncbi:hypothetical protein [Candidatus Poriferisodalis sp.]|uniref:hypothetical protein n=1 Tax=Candidatus Poriferisodalis sp. TaxID=3101277 RepID=UPI003B024F35
MPEHDPELAEGVSQQPRFDTRKSNGALLRRIGCVSTVEGQQLNGEHRDKQYPEAQNGDQETDSNDHGAEPKSHSGGFGRQYGRKPDDDSDSPKRGYYRAWRIGRRRRIRGRNPTPTVISHERKHRFQVEFLATDGEHEDRDQNPVDKCCRQ